MRRNNFNGLQSLSSHATLMMSVLRNNKRERIGVLEKIKKYSNKNSTQIQITKNATKEQLNNIRISIKKQNRRKLILQFLFVGLVSITLLIAIGFVKF
ncbi:hypothetical protein EV195_104108 [Tenacibaculum skagerrakense]|uniref:Uncharacterized protein n=1 Tax=Tenacibaculum skagerrakense TaxID=186571 RepID=A0A4R2NT99_9FLAO|nr:hypothetical protein [Tenacibaculum skagerrakense]TCP25077.1 hypothetical protein EV195_104108 [Tenacibaculum skagerrakense]